MNNPNRIKWSKGNIIPFWKDNDDFKNLDYIRVPASEKDIQEWESQGYSKNINYTGKSYNNSRPMPEWTARFKNIFQLSNMSFTFYKMETLDVMPTHVDAFSKYMQLAECDIDDVRRVIIMLEDWKPGHYLEIAGQSFASWKAGDWFMWRADVPHAAANIGVEDRYTLQITGIDYAVNDNWQHLHWFNFTDFPAKRDTIKSSRMQKIDELLNNNNGVPYMVYFYNGKIADLESIKHSVEVADQLNRTGVDIYLYEPICSYDEIGRPYHPPMGNKMSMQFYSEFHHSIESDPSRLRALELDSIATYAKNNHLTNVRVHTCDYNIERYTAYEDVMQLYTDDLFLKVFDLSEFEPLADDEDTGSFTKKFVSLNWRYTPHRQLIAAYLAGKDYAYLTWYFKSAIQNFMEEPWYNLKVWREQDEIFYSLLLKGIRYINDNGPLTLDLNVKEVVTIGHPYFREVLPHASIREYKDMQNQSMDMLKNVYNDVFCDIVTETRYAQPTANISEKTLRAIYYKKPFVLVGPRGSLEYLHQMGFRTFSDWWDESYDSTADHEERFFKVLGIISHLEQEPMEVLHAKYKEMSDVLEHNRQHLIYLLAHK